ncbi:MULTISPECIES: mycofactocin-coupled SDR family oxidoreductase [Mycolicibacterium]|jgi:SDR family mycofactocin-dependent oxidoreductase|uniref:Short-chain dehydrogenase/reductase SDR n=1 Tax=Mycolicibacterium vanbaalenii (strain DSM 7251 / JCM 13017 / BCRC 16820 / KCTC 9966 / NRRL B-24157 / PYR-1) TaxID=350058 RepID=A1T7C0_MYCVP|nr:MULTISPECIES: mycofactocin-coupled SDR family oxidoreductase [Mycolicibacterium]ABM13070.1 short-chain dehydrogenase/reductase SDR [Mycolicibacterium vanbaalenii PYR-1]MDW5613649.1 mycofactocin-coupled SDR family oxidoreductase [Mycolicibacterium sp. D5.8-2]QZY48306.1 mycofactocin-coupled SDR family oxidoreductase [Mycolicibacterium austroafricanum]UJL26816.1 mycofactocin-coupled SDR family oxidoreductase [Mycolicibacterium vanbaalenii]WND58936.1 mycofactocin-coupled SDR family oxidoreducta
MASQVLQDKVVFVTGAARGQGRAHAVRFAEEGADVIAFDLCAQIDSVAYPMATPEDLDETVRLVEKTGRRIVAERGDVRDRDRLAEVVARGVAEFGRLDFVLANAGILPAAGPQGLDITAFTDAIAVMLNGVYFTIEAALPALLRNPDGGAIVITSSAAGFTSVSTEFGTMSHGAAGYTAAKHGVIGVMRHFARSLAEKNIRVNSVHPGGVATPMVLNQAMADWSGEHPSFSAAQQPLLRLPMMEPEAVSDAMVYLCGPSGRYLTGATLPLDAGQTLK